MILSITDYKKIGFLAEAKPFLRTEIAQSYRSVQEIFQHLERSGDIKVGKYDVLKEIVKFNVKMLEEIEKTEMAMITLGGPVIWESDNGCDKYLMGEVKSSPTHVSEWLTAAGDIANINLELQEHHIDLVSKNSEKCEWFNTNMETHNNLMKESNSILGLLKAKDRDERMNKFVELARKSKELLVSHADAFQTFASRWRNLNRVLIQNCQLITLLKEKGAKFRGFLQSSLFIFFQFESIQMLDIFWNEYTSGSLSTEVRGIIGSEKMTADDKQVCCLHFSEENYRRHKIYLGMKIEMTSGRPVTQESHEIAENVGKMPFSQILNDELVSESEESEMSYKAEKTDFLQDDEHSKVSTLTEMSDTGTLENPPLKCGICGKNASLSMFCRNCSFPLCDKCAQDHQSDPGYKFHAIIPCTDVALLLYGKDGLAQQCQTHPEKEISTYCNACQVPCCISCLVKDHKLHDYSAIEDKFLDVKRNLQDYTKQLDTLVSPKVEEMEVKDKLNVKRVADIFEDFREKAFQKFNEREERVEFKKSKERIKTVKSEIIQKFNERKLDLIDYKPPSHQSLLPNVNLKQVIPMYLSDTMIVEILRERCLRVLNVVIKKSFRACIGVNSMCRSGRMAWVMCWDSESLYLYGESGKVERSKAMKGMGGINDMAINQSGDLIITCCDGKVRRVPVSGEVSTLLDLAPCGCFGVCLTDKEEIVVCVSDKNEKNYIAVYSPDGSELVLEIQGKEGLFTYPYRVVQNGKDLCVVDAGGNRSVYCIDQEGGSRWAYDGRQAKNKSPFYAHAICADKYQNLLITDINNHCIHYVDRNGGLIQVILSREETQLSQLQGICVDDDTEQIWIGNTLTKDVIIAKYLE